MQVVLQRVHHGAMGRIHDRVGTLERTRLGRIRMQHLGRERRGRGCRALGPPGHLDVLEALVREAPDPGFVLAGTGQDEPVGLEAVREPAVVREIDPTVGLQFLAVLCTDRGAGSALRRDPHIARNDPGEHHAPHTGRHLDDFGRGQFFGHPDRLLLLVDEIALGPGDFGGRHPARVIESPYVEAGVDVSRVVRLAAIEVVQKGRTVVDRPRVVGHEIFGRPVLVLDPQERTTDGIVVEGRVLPVPHIRIGHPVEAAPELDAQRVAARTYLRGDIGHGVL